MAVFMKDHIGAKLAMECDQGGSSTMWIDGQGIVSNPGSGARAVYNGLFLTYQL
jgi:exopolysaccharide biosynthesis protein